MFHPTTKGILTGRIVGLNNSINITGYILKVGKGNIEIPDYYTSPGIEYYIGFGTGYELGQKLRGLLEKDTSSQLSLDKKIECFSFLLKRQEICKVNLTTQSFLDNIKYWEEFTISSAIIDEVQSLIKQNKTQRAIYKLISYFKEKFYLKALMEFYEIYASLEKLRAEKRKNKEYFTGEELEKIKTEVLTWIG